MYRLSTVSMQSVISTATITGSVPPPLPTGRPKPPKLFIPHNTPSQAVPPQTPSPPVYRAALPGEHPSVSRVGSARPSKSTHCFVYTPPRPRLGQYEHDCHPAPASHENAKMSRSVRANAALSNSGGRKNWIYRGRSEGCCYCRGRSDLESPSRQEGGGRGSRRR